MNECMPSRTQACVVLLSQAAGVSDPPNLLLPACLGPPNLLLAACLGPLSGGLGMVRCPGLRRYWGAESLGLVHPVTKLPPVPARPWRGPSFSVPAAPLHSGGGTYSLFGSCPVARRKVRSVESRIRLIHFWVKAK